MISFAKRSSRWLVLPAAALAVALVAWHSGFAQEAPVKIPAPKEDMPLASQSSEATAVLAGGCFWGMQGVFEHVKGVKLVLSGYSGGTVANPGYEEVSSGTTGHAESIEIKYDPSQVTYGTLLQVYFSVAHNPTELNRQGPDEGTQYRSAVFYSNDDQKKVATAYIAQLNTAGAYSSPIVTEVTAFKAFYAAEDYHQKFLDNNPNYPYIVYWDLPKIANLQRTYPDLVAANPPR